MGRRGTREVSSRSPSHTHTHIRNIYTHTKNKKKKKPIIVKNSFSRKFVCLVGLSHPLLAAHPSENEVHESLNLGHKEKKGGEAMNACLATFSPHPHLHMHTPPMHITAGK